MTTADAQYLNLSPEQPSISKHKRKILVGTAILAVVGVLCVSIAVVVPRGTSSDNTFSTHSRAQSTSGKLKPEWFLFRNKVDLKTWVDIKAAFFNPLSSHGNMPFPISGIFENLFTSNGRVFFGAQDTEGTPSRLDAVNDAITRLGYSSDDFKAVGIEMARMLHNNDKDGVRRLMLNLIVPRFVPNFKISSDFVDDYGTFYKYLLPGTSWLDPLRPWKMSSAKARILPAINNREDVFHHINAAHGLIDVLFTIPKTEVGRDIMAAQANGGSYDVMRLFSGSDAPAGTVPRTMKDSTNLGGVVDGKLDKGDLVFLVTDRPNLNFREERFLGCAGQRMVTQIAKYTVDAFYPGVRTVILRPGTPDEVLNPSSTALFQQQGEL